MPASKPASKTAPKPASKSSGGSSSQSGSTSKPSKAPAESSSNGGFGVLPESFINSSKAESVAGKRAVQEALSVVFVDGDFSPFQKSDEIKTFSDRLKKEDHPAWNGRPTVVFYTCEGATKTQISPTKQQLETVFELQSSAMSIRAYEEIFDVVKSVEACIYSMFVNLVRVDISGITPEQDPFINNETGPFMGFFNIDGQCVSMLQGNQVGSGGYIRSICQLIGNPAATRERFAQVKAGLDKIEQMTRQQYLMSEDVKAANDRAKQASSNKTKRMGSGTDINLSAKKSVDETRVDQLKEKMASVDKDISGTRSELHGLTGRAVGCEGCPVCLEKAAAAAAAASGTATVASSEEESNSE